MTIYHKHYESWKKFLLKEQTQGVPNIEIEDWVRQQPWYIQRKEKYGPEAAEAFAKYISAKQQGQPENVLNALQAAYKQADQKSMQTAQQQTQPQAAAQQKPQLDYKTHKWYQETLQKHGEEAAEALKDMIATSDPELKKKASEKYYQIVSKSNQQKAQTDAAQSKARADAAQTSLDNQRSEFDKNMKDMMSAHTAKMNDLTKQGQANASAAVNALNPQQQNQVQETKTCANCGNNKLRATAKFCTKCGAAQQMPKQ